MKPEFHIYNDRLAMASAVAAELVHFLQEGRKAERPLHLALSGGSTPSEIFRQLAAGYARADWSGLHFYWGDERCVAPDDERSNYGTAKKLLFDPLGLHPSQIHRIRGENDPEEESRRYGELLQSELPLENGIPIFDWIWLGIGNDGHTASVFPGQIGLWDDPGPCAVAQHPELDERRVTFTGAIINTARRVSFLAAGSEKAGVLSALAGPGDHIARYPASLVEPYKGNLDYFLDLSAASKLSGT